MTQIARFLGVTFSDNMLRFYKSPVARVISQLDHHRNLLRPVFSDSISRYKTVLTDEQLAIIKDRLSTPMRYFGYLSNTQYEKINRDLLLT